MEGPPPPLASRPHVRRRAASDLDPLDIADPAARLRLASYVWAGPARSTRALRRGATLALALDVRVERADAAEWLEERLPQRARDAATVVYHSIFLQYPPRETRERSQPRSSRRGAQPRRRSRGCGSSPRPCSADRDESVRLLIDLITWPGGERRMLGATDGHVRFVDARV